MLVGLIIYGNYLYEGRCLFMEVFYVGFLLMLNEWKVCVFVDRWRIDKIDFYCFFVLLKLNFC